MYRHKPFSQACEENKRPIGEVLGPYLAKASSVLEIGSGTGQHAVYFAAAFPHLNWLTSDVPDNLPGIRVWLEEAGLANLPPPIPLEVITGPWPDARFDLVFSANTAHILSEVEVVAMLAGIPRVLEAGGLFALYGPFNYGGRYTSASNARFDTWLKANDPRSGIKDFEWLDELARGSGLALLADHEMPVNNRTLVWGKTG